MKNKKRILEILKQVHLDWINKNSEKLELSLPKNERGAIVFLAGTTPDEMKILKQKRVYVFGDVESFKDSGHAIFFEIETIKKIYDKEIYDKSIIKLVKEYNLENEFVIIIFNKINIDNIIPEFNIYKIQKKK